MGKFIDLKGKQFGRWTVLEFHGLNKHKTGMWLCQCSCDKNIKRLVNGNDLRNGKSKSCGCLRTELIEKNLIGLKYGKLTVLFKFGINNSRNNIWVCECDCGNFVMVNSYNLLTGHTKSCGCLRSETMFKRMFVNIVGFKFGKLTVLCKCGKTKKGLTIWLCQCECGGFKFVSSCNLLNGRTKSCGCINKIMCMERTGKNNPNWNGGTSFEPYCEKFNSQLKEKIRNKYNRKCILCGKTEEDNGRKLDVHHVNYNKNQGCNDDKWLLVPLCRKCHGKTHYNRNFWKFNLKWLIHCYNTNKELYNKLNYEYNDLNDKLDELKIKYGVVDE